jgi:predicted lipoprotein with Yx(FWY)xxD motif
MKGHRVAITIVTGAVALSAIGFGASAAANATPAIAPKYGSAPAPSASMAKSATKRVTLHAAKAAVDGKTETILLNASNLPLYYYDRDTATESLVTGGLAELWPPLLSASPTETGARGKLSVLVDASGHQVAYNGHFLYTFAEDRPGKVTGQGVEGFFVATPNLTKVAASAMPAAMTSTSWGGATTPTTSSGATTPTTSSGGTPPTTAYGYGY